MRASKVTLRTLQKAAASVHVEADIEAKGKGFRVKLYPMHFKGIVPYQRKSASFFSQNRKVHAVCWHGFRDFFRAVYAIEPEAVFSTAFATYRGRDNFEETFSQTAYRNIGSQVYPVYASEACFCE